MFNEVIATFVSDALANAHFPAVDFSVIHPELLEHGDYTTNVALSLSKQLKKSPHEIAALIVSQLPVSKIVERTEIAGPGFINFFLKEKFFHEQLAKILEEGDSFGHGISETGRRLMYEYTDPNPFKVFHIGHLMTNTIGEALSRLAERQGAAVVRANYQGDVGLHIGRALYGMQALKETMPMESALDVDKAAWLADAYVYGAQAYTESVEAKAEIDRLNRVVYEHNDVQANKLYEIGRRWSLAHFEELYRKLGTHFDYYIFESEVAPVGMRVVLDYLQKGLFAQSEGATIFDGEKYGLHKRVFITQAGLPTYECKDIGNNLLKFEKEPNLDRSYIFTGVEQLEYMKVVLKAMEQIRPDIAVKTVHVTHGLMLGPDGKKMSSRKGGAPSGEGLLTELESLVAQKLVNGKFEFSESEREEVAEKVAVAAIKYVILRQQYQKNVIFNHDEATSFEGDSGPYLQYSYARARSIMRKAEEKKIRILKTTNSVDLNSEACEPPGVLERNLYRLPEILNLAHTTMTPSHLTTYLVKIAHLFNLYYASTKVLDSEHAPYRLALVAASAQVLRNGLVALGIPVIERM